MKTVKYCPKPGTTLLSMLLLLLAVPALASPPPWAPAHGYRNKHLGSYSYRPVLPWHGRDYYNEYILDGRCDRERLGAVLGGMVGSIAGSQIGRGSDRTTATIAGTVIGVLVGRSIGRHMDNNDQQCTGQVLEHAPDRAPVHWRDPHDGTAYEVTPLNTFRHQDGRYCREYTTRASIGGRSREIYGQACRQADGSWTQR